MKSFWVLFMGVLKANKAQRDGIERAIARKTPTNDTQNEILSSLT